MINGQFKECTFEKKLTWQEAKHIAKTLHVGLMQEYGEHDTKRILRALRKKEYTKEGVE